MNTQPTVLAGTFDRKVIRLQSRGKVQGVYYRASKVDAARHLEVTGGRRERNIDRKLLACLCVVQPLQSH